MIQIEDIEVVYDRGTQNEVTALQIPCLDIGSQCWCCIIGPNGSGKTTLLRIFSGGLESFEGTVHLDGNDVTNWKTRQFYDLVQVVEQNPEKNTVPSMTIEENLDLYASRQRFPSLSFLRGRHQKQILDLLSQFRMGLENRLSSQVGLLSGGQKQAVALAGVLLRKPKVLLLDEFLTSIDPKTSPKLLSVVQQFASELKITVLMISHDLENVVTSGDRIIILSNGRIVEDICTSEHDLTKTELVSRYSTVIEKEGII